MARDLKIYMRGKGVAQLQELLQRMGYSIHDKPALFGVSTRDAVKDFQSKKGLKATGIVDDSLMSTLRNNFGQPEAKKQKKSADDAQHLNTAHLQLQLDTVIALLIKKGIFTQQELSDEMDRPKPKRVVLPPLT